jgi:hypothetical protein
MPAGPVSCRAIVCGVVRRGRLSAFAATLATVLAALGAGCGALPPQAPAPVANGVAEALSGIAAACGEQAQLTALPAFGSEPRREAAVIASARMRSVELSHAVAKNPASIYQGKTLGEVRGLAAQRLRECGLAQAARVLHG